MSNVTGIIRARTNVTEPTIYNVTVTLANTEVSQTLSDATKSFTITVRNGGSPLKLAFTAGDSGLIYITIPSGASYTAESLNFSGTLYFQTTKPSQIVEILEWV